MRGTALVYSSHDRSPYLHRQLIVERALQGHRNKRILFLPMSETLQNGSEMERQEFSWSNFEWYLGQFRKWGLEAFPFYWSSSLKRGDLETLWDLLRWSEVVIFGGGHSLTGMKRYKNLGWQYDGEWGKVGRILHERRADGLLTVGFSAGADQLCESLFRRSYGDEMDGKGFGLVRNTMITLHHDSSRNDELEGAARQFPDHMLFGLPNDSGLNHDFGVLPSGNIWQAYEFVIDTSWDEPSDAFHVRTRMGAKIEHVDAHGRHWAFGGGDLLVRVESPDGRYREAWMRCGGEWLHYGTRQHSRFQSEQQILAEH